MPSARMAAVIALGSILASSCASCSGAKQAGQGEGRPDQSATRTQSPALAGCPAAVDAEELPVLTRAVPGPDDMFVSGNGTIWLTDEEHGTINQLSADGRLLRSVANDAQPEGIVALPDGAVLVAEKSRNRVIKFDPSLTRSSELVSLPNSTGNPGIDGLGLDLPGNRLLIPDSPNGVLRAMSLSGGPPTVLARGLGRPVAATVGPGDRVYVAAESTVGLAVVSGAGGDAVPLGSFTDLDDVVTDGGLLYVSDFGTGTVAAVEASSGDSRILVQGMRHRDGLALLSKGRLALTDEEAGTVSVVRSCP